MILSVCPVTCLSVFLSVRLSAYLSTCLLVCRLVCLSVYTTRSQIEKIEEERSLLRCRAEVSSASWHSFTHPVRDTIVEDVDRVQTTQWRSEGTTASKYDEEISYRRDVYDRWLYSILTSEFASAQSEMKISDLIQTTMRRVRTGIRYTLWLHRVESDRIQDLCIHFYEDLTFKNSLWNQFMNSKLKDLQLSLKMILILRSFSFSIFLASLLLTMWFWRGTWTYKSLPLNGKGFQILPNDINCIDKNDCRGARRRFYFLQERGRHEVEDTILTRRIQIDIVFSTGKEKSMHWIKKDHGKIKSIRDVKFFVLLSRLWFFRLTRRDLTPKSSVRASRTSNFWWRVGNA